MNISNPLVTGYNLLNLTNVVTISIESLPDDTKQTLVSSDSNLVVLVLDKSGSMAGNPIKKAKESIFKLIQSLYASHQFMLVAYAGYHKIFTTYYDSTIGGDNYKTTNGAKDVQFYDYRNKDISFIEKSIQSIECAGSTSFEVAFDCIRNNLSTVKNKPVGHIIFFTDGTDTDAKSPKDTMIALDLLTTKLEVAMTHPQIHCLGFSKEHDAKFLGDLTTKLATDGTFQYIETVDDMETKISNLIPLLDKSVICGTLSNSHDSFKFTMKETNNHTKSCVVYLPIDCALGDKYKLELELDNENNFSQDIDIIDTEFDIESNMDDIVNFLGKLIADKTTFMINSAVTETDFIEISSIFENFCDSVESIKNKIDSITTITKRNDINQKYLSVRSNIEKFAEFLTKAVVGEVKNEDIAKMFDIAYSGSITKKVSSSTTAGTTGTNTNTHDTITTANTKEEEINELYEMLYHELENRAENDRGNLELYNITNKNTFNELDTYLNVSVDKNKPTQLMSNGDCLCLCVKVSRTPQVTQYPALLQITEVYPITMSASSFQDKYKFALENAGVEESDSEEQKFVKRDNMIIYGKNKEEINAVMPLYVCEEHWFYAKNWLRILCGLITTTDPIEYSHDQYNTFPFLVFTKVFEMLKNNENNVNRTLFALVEETCFKIYKDSEKITTMIDGVFEQYIQGKVSVCRDSMLNNSLLVSYLYFSKLDYKFGTNLSVTKQGIFITKMIEEEARRNQVNHKNSTITVDFLLKILNLDKKVWIDNHVKAYEKEKYLNKSKNIKNYKSAIYKELKAGGMLIDMSDDESNEDNEDSSLPDGFEAIDLDSDTFGQNQDISIQQNTSDPSTWNGTIYEMSAIGQDLWDYTNYMYETYAMGNLVLLPAVFSSEPFDVSLKGIGIGTEEQKLTFALQNYMHNRDEVRNNSIENNTYYNPFKLNESKRFLVNIFTELVNKEKSKRFKSVDYKYEYLLSDEQAEVFAMTHNLYEAAGALKGAFIGANINKFFKKLQTKKCVRALEKMEMLIEGTYTVTKYNSDLNTDDVVTIELYGDKMTTVPCVKWKPSKQNCFRLWKQNQSLLEPHDWNDLFTGINEKCRTKCNVFAWYYYYGEKPIYKTKYAAYRKNFIRRHNYGNQVASYNRGNKSRQGFSNSYNGCDDYDGYDDHNTGFDDNPKPYYPSDMGGHCSYIV